MKILDSLVTRPLENVKHEIYTSNRKYFVGEWANFFLLMGRVANLASFGRIGITGQQKNNIEGTYSFLERRN